MLHRRSRTPAPSPRSISRLELSPHSHTLCVCLSAFLRHNGRCTETHLNAVHQQRCHPTIHIQRQATDTATTPDPASNNRPPSALKSQDNLRPAPEPQPQCRDQPGELRLSIRGDGHIRPAEGNRHTGFRETVRAISMLWHRSWPMLTNPD